MPAEPVVCIRDLEFSFGQGELKKTILRDLTLDIMPGEIVILAGPSGSGKTTLLTLIGALRSVQLGSVRVLGKELRGASEWDRTQIRRQMGFIFQLHNLLPFLTATQNVQMAAQLQPSVSKLQAREQARQMLKSVGLGDRLDYHPDKLSGGQKQRVAVARALVSKPKLILADEPTAALDGKTGREVVTLLQKLAREQHCPVLLVTHDQRVYDVADRIIHMEDGKLQQDGAV